MLACFCGVDSCCDDSVAGVNLFRLLKRSDEGAAIAGFGENRPPLEGADAVVEAPKLNVGWAFVLGVSVSVDWPNKFVVFEDDSAGFGVEVDA